MANLKQSKKRARQDKIRRVINKSNLSTIRTYIKKFLKLVSLKDVRLASEKYRFLVSKIDKGAQKGLYKKSKASRIKSRLNSKLKLAKGV